MEAKQTPLIELLEQVPHDARVVVEHDQFSSSSHPVGRLCHEAAAALRARLAQPEMNQWHGLTDEEVSDVIDGVLEGGGWLDVARALEAAIKDKNKW
ncbi:MAG: hypothetical protein EBR30_28340 [Cytophagia bacterium]|nr:hypothetical protein [Cytophagia bacterium]